MVGDVDLHRQTAPVRLFDLGQDGLGGRFVDVPDGDGVAAFGQEPHRSGTDTRRSPVDDGDATVVLSHVHFLLGLSELWPGPGAPRGSGAWRVASGRLRPVPV